MWTLTSRISQSACQLDNTGSWRLHILMLLRLKKHWSTGSMCEQDQDHFHSWLCFLPLGMEKGEGSIIYLYLHYHYFSHIDMEALNLVIILPLPIVLLSRWMTMKLKPLIDLPHLAFSMEQSLASSNLSF